MSLNFEEEAKIQRKKINYFNSKVGNNDFDEAINYLILADWNERTAVNIYMNQHRNSNNRKFPQINNYINNQRPQQPQHYPQQPRQPQYYPQQPQYYPQQPQYYPQQPQYYPQQPQHHPQQQPQLHPESLDQSNNNNYPSFHIKDEFLRNNVTYRNEDSSNYKNFLNYLNGRFIMVAQTFDSFLKSLKDHSGVIILLNSNKFNEVKNHMRKIIDNELSNQIVRNSVLFPIMMDSLIGNQLVNLLSCFNFPSYIICKYKNQSDINIIGRMEGSFSTTFLIDKILQAFPDSKTDLKQSMRQSLKRSILSNSMNNIMQNNNNEGNLINNNDHNYYNDAFLGTSNEFNQFIESLGKSNINDNLNNNQNLNDNLNNSNNNNINIKDSIAGLSDAQIYEKREKEMKELERQHEEKMKKEEEEKKRKIDEENKIKKRNEEYQKEAEISKQLLPDEPDENNPNACKIVLRYPIGEKSIERRFLKTDKIEDLYILVKSKGREIFFEQESNDFTLTFGFPPKNLENYKSRTLEEEGLFPNAIIQIREK